MQKLEKCLKMKRPNMALAKHGFKTKDQNWSHLRGDKTVEKKTEEEKREEEEEEEKKKRREVQAKTKKVWNYMGF